MKYETPVMEIKDTEEQDIITLSGVQGGDGPVVETTSITGNESF